MPSCIVGEKRMNPLKNSPDYSLTLSLDPFSSLLRLNNSAKQLRKPPPKWMVRVFSKWSELAPCLQ